MLHACCKTIPPPLYHRHCLPVYSVQDYITDNIKANVCLLGGGGVLDDNEGELHIRVHHDLVVPGPDVRALTLVHLSTQHKHFSWDELGVVSVTRRCGEKSGDKKGISG